MAKYKVLAVVNNEEKRLQLRQRLSRADGVALVGFASVDADIMTRIKGYAPHVVLLVQEQGDAGIMELAQRIYQGFPGCAVALLVPTLEMELVRSAMQAGVRQVISEENWSSLNDALVQAAMVEQGRSNEAGGEPRIIAFYSGKGGVGRTTLAVNLAVALATAGRRTALIDLGLNFGDASLLLNINAKDTIAELVQEKTSFLIEDIKSFSMQHSSGLNILCAPSSPEFAEYINAKHVEMLLNTMRPYYDFIIVDLPNDLTEPTLTAMENADDIYLVARKDISSLRSLKILIGILTTLQQAEKLHVLINADRQSIVNQKDFDRILGLPVDFLFPEDDKTAQQSQERGVPLVIGFPRTPLAMEINHFAEFLIDRSTRKDATPADDAGDQVNRTSARSTHKGQANRGDRPSHPSSGKSGSKPADAGPAKPRGKLFSRSGRGGRP